MTRFSRAVLSPRAPCAATASDRGDPRRRARRDARARGGRPEPARGRPPGLDAGPRSTSTSLQGGPLRRPLPGRARLFRERLLGAQEAAGTFWEQTRPASRRTWGSPASTRTCTSSSSSTRCPASLPRRGRWPRAGHSWSASRTDRRGDRARRDRARPLTRSDPRPVDRDAARIDVAAPGERCRRAARAVGGALVLPALTLFRAAWTPHHGGPS